MNFTQYFYENHSAVPESRFERPYHELLEALLVQWNKIWPGLREREQHMAIGNYGDGTWGTHLIAKFDALPKQQQHAIEGWLDEKEEELCRLHDLKILGRLLAEMEGYAREGNVEWFAQGILNAMRFQYHQSRIADPYPRKFIQGAGELAQEYDLDGDTIKQIVQMRLVELHGEEAGNMFLFYFKESMPDNSPDKKRLR